LLIIQSKLLRGVELLSFFELAFENACVASLSKFLEEIVLVKEGVADLQLFV
jgi:hypothetical protein